MIRLRWEVTGKEATLRLLQRQGPAAVREAIHTGLRDVATAVIQEAQRNLTALGKRTFGTLFASLGMVFGKDGEGDYVEVGPGLSPVNRPTSYGDPRNYGWFVEHGRGPGGMPPERAIQAWARRKIGDDSPGTVFAIRRAIGQFGVAPAPFLFPALEKAAQGGGRRIFFQALERAVRRLE